VEFSVLDLFDVLDSQLKKLFPETKRKPQSKQGEKTPATSFVRYNTWIEAHNFVIATEEAECLSQARTCNRLLAQAGLLGAEDASTGDLLEDETVDSGSVEMSDEEEESLDEVESISEGGDAESVASGEKADEFEGSNCDSSEEDSDDDEPSDEEDGINEAAAEEAYLRQLQDEAFESELRKLTMDALEKGKISARTGAGGKVSSQMPAAPQFIAKKTGDDTSNPFDGGISFKLLKKGNKGKMEEKKFLVPSSTNLARRATKQDDEAAKERDLLKARVLQYEAESAEVRHTGGSMYLDDSKLQVIRNRPLTMDAIDSNFGKSKDAPYKVSDRSRGRGTGGRWPGGGRGRGSGRLFNPGRGS
jgi:regulator of nonsense transcripts 2